MTTKTYHRAALALLALLTLLTGCSRSPKLDEKSIRQFLDKSLAAASRLDTDASCALLADKVEVHYVVIRLSGSDTKRMNKSEYCAEVRQSYDTLKASGAKPTYTVNVKSIDIAPGGKAAVVDGDAVASFSMMGQMLSVRTTQISTIQLINGQPLFTVIRASTTGGQ